MNVFDGSSFTLINMVGAFKESQYTPQFLKQFFENVGSTTKVISIEKQDKTLVLVPFSERGTPLDENNPEPRELRYFETVRLAKGDTIQASEISGIRAFGTDSELKMVHKEVTERITDIKGDIEITFEYLRLGALQGKFMNPKDGTVKYNWFTEFGVAQAAEVNFALTTTTTDVPGLARKERRRIIRESGTAVTPQTKVVAICDDDFFDKLISHESVTETYLNQTAANRLREMQNQVFDSVDVGGIEFFNYRGSDDTKVRVPTDKCVIFPTGVKGNLVHAQAPADEFMDFVNSKGIEFYSLLEQDPATNKKWVRPECYAYPLIYVARPKTLGRGKSS